MNNRWLLLMSFIAMPGLALAGDLPAGEPSVQDNIRAMDVNRDGMVTASEIRAFVEARRGKGYQNKLLDEMEAQGDARSCASPFSGTFF